MKRLRDSSHAEEDEPLCIDMAYFVDFLEHRSEDNMVLLVGWIIDEASMDGYRAILEQCDIHSMSCPYLLGSDKLPMFHEPVLRSLDSSELLQLFGLFAAHRRGSRTFFVRMLRHFPFVDERVVDIFWMQTASLWLPEDRALLQQAAIFSSHPWLLRKLRFEAKWDASLIPRGALHVVGNVEACKLLLCGDSRFEVNNTEDWDRMGIMALYCARSAEIVSCLLEAHADVARVLECSDTLPAVDVIRWIFEKCSAERVWNVLWSPAAFFSKKTNDPLLRVIGLLDQFHCVIPTQGIALDDETRCALFTFGYIDALPLGTCVHLSWLAWRPWTHHFFPSSLHESVWCVLLCCKRICPTLSRDLRIHLLYWLLL
jgi:hypothetical protein